MKNAEFKFFTFFDAFNCTIIICFCRFIVKSLFFALSLPHPLDLLLESLLASRESAEPDHPFDSTQHSIRCVRASDHSVRAVSNMKCTAARPRCDHPDTGDFAQSVARAASSSSSLLRLQTPDDEMIRDY